MAKVMKLPILAMAGLSMLFLAACIISTPTPESVTETDESGSPVPTATIGAEVQGSTTVAPSGSTGPTSRTVQLYGASVTQYSQAPPMTLDLSSTYAATIRTNHGPINLNLFASRAPKTVNNFVFLAEEGFYDGIMFHRVINGFMIQGGDPTGTGFAGPGYKFEDEFDPSLLFDSSGILAMANSGPNTNGSQFFITVGRTPNLNGRHTIFGRVTSGQDVVEAISLVNKGQGDRPIDPVVIQTIEIITSGG